MEREVLLTGIGGQGIQLAAQVLARAATAARREVMTLGTYGGTMRGGSTASCLVVADAPISTPPLVSRAWAGLGMHARDWPPVAEKLRPGGVAFVNAPLFDAGTATPGGVSLCRVDADGLAREAEAPLAGALVLAAAFSAATGFVSQEALVAGMIDALPPYRHQHVEANTRAIDAGWSAAPGSIAPAWEAAA